MQEATGHIQTLGDFPSITVTATGGCVTFRGALRGDTVQ